MFSEVVLQQMPEKLQQLCNILQQASQIIHNEYNDYIQGQDFSIIQKEDQSPVTQADLKANAFITEQLSRLLPTLPILSEEGQHEGRENWKTFWMLDPLDGTKEFINQTGEFTINLSLIDGYDSVISAIAVPLKKVIYIGEVNKLPFRYQWTDSGIFVSQFFHSDHNDHDVIRIAMSRRPEKNSLYAEFQDFLDRSNIAYEIISAGSAYKFCMMLEGEIDIYPRFHPTSEWDTAAGQGLLQSIGGDIFDLSHKPFRYNIRPVLLNGRFVALKNIDHWQQIDPFLNPS